MGRVKPKGENFLKPILDSYKEFLRWSGAHQFLAGSLEYGTLGGMPRGSGAYGLDPNVFPDSAHFPHIDEPERFNEAAIAFLSR
jgi:pimeloyl-ACP methyl ester carboxylesterase